MYKAGELNSTVMANLGWEGHVHVLIIAHYRLSMLAHSITPIVRHQQVCR